MRVPDNFVALTEDREQVLNDNLHLARLAAQKFTRSRSRSHVEHFDEMHSAALLGLMVAAGNYSPERIAEFPRYAGFYMKKAMSKRIYENTTGGCDSVAHHRRLRRTSFVGMDDAIFSEEGGAEQIMVDHRRSDLDMLELREEVDTVLSIFSPRDQYLMRSHWMENVKVPVLAAEVGLSKHGVSRALIRAAQKARAAREAV